MKKYIVSTIGLAYVIDCSTDRQVKQAISKLKKLGYKKPQVYRKTEKFSEREE